MSLPQYNTQDAALSQLMTTWPAIINPVINSLFSSPTILKSIVLVPGTNAINHLLGTNLQGWLIVRQRGASQIYDIQDTNPIPSKTLLLRATSGVTVDLAVF